MNKIIVEIKKNSRFQAWSILNFAIAFMLCIFAPIDAYYANMDEYWFSIGQMLSVCIVVFVVLFIVLEIIAYFISRSKISDTILAVFSAVFAYFYIQGNYIPRNYGVLNGTDIDWNSYQGYGIASIVLLLICIIGAVSLVLRFRKYIRKCARVLGIFILLIQVVTITTLVIQNGFDLSKTMSQTSVVTSKNLFDLSRNNNIIVFLLDTYDASDFEYLLENNYQNQAEIFEDFTYYRDTLGAYPTTKCSLPYILTGVWYENKEPYSDYIARAYDNNEIYKAFEVYNWEIDMYGSAMFISANTDIYDNIEFGTYNISDAPVFASKLFKLVAFNYMPHQLKQFFFMETSEFIDLRESNVEYPVYSSNVISFSNKFDNEGISSSREGNVFKFYHLDGVHGTYTFGSDLREDGKKYTVYDEAAGNNELIKKYLEDMKEADIYDKSTIIIMSDHGLANYSQNPIFFIKNTNERHDFRISDEEMSWEFLKHIWVELASGGNVDEDFISSCEPDMGYRRYLYYRWDDAWSRTYMPAMEEFLCNGTAYNSENLATTGNSFTPETENHNYKLGTTLEFISGRSAYSYVLYGISYGQLSSESAMAFDFNEKIENLQVEIVLPAYYAADIVTVKANDKIVAYKVFVPEDGKVTFAIPRDYIENQHLELSFVVGETEELSRFDTTSVKFDKITITSIDNDVDLADQISPYKYEIGNKIGFFSDNPSGHRYVRDGFSVVESWGTWTDGYEATLRFKLDDVSENLFMNIEYTVFDNEQQVQVYGNDTLLADYIAVGSEIATIDIPKEILDSEYLDIKFNLPDAHPPASLDANNGEARILGLGLKYMSIDIE